MKKIFFLQLLLLEIDFLLFISCKKDTSCEDCRETNSPPIAIAGSDQVITLPTDSISLDGSASNDPDGKISEWLWTKISGPASFAISSAASAKTKVMNLAAGTYQFELTVTDDKGAPSKDTMVVTVDADLTSNRAPIAIAGPDQVITLPTDSISLDGSASSDPDGTLSDWLWTKISGPASFAISSAASTKTTVNNLAAGTYQFELSVTDDEGASSKDTMVVTVDTVLTPNHAPIANAGADQIITLPTNAIILDGSGSTDPDNNIASYQWTKISGPSSFNANANTVLTHVTGLVEGVYQFELKVTDNGGLSAKDTMRVIVIQPNRPPVANAGVDQTITLPISTVNLNGNASTDPDNNITNYLWTKISGPSSPNIVNARVVQTQVLNLIEGVYKFELRVTDAGQLYSNDTVQVIVMPSPPLACNNINRPIINAQLIPIGKLSQARIDMAVTSAGNKILFAGGVNDSWAPSSRVDIYDITTNNWSTAELSIGRYDGIGATSNGNKIFFGGGEYGDGTWPVDSVDIYDVATNTWTVSHLSKAGNRIEAIAVGNKVFFAGGNSGFSGGANRNKQIDIYDLSTGLWSALQLSNILSEGNPVAVVNNKIYFSGFLILRNPDNSGYYATTNRIEVYDVVAGSWSVDYLQTAKSPSASVAIGNKIFWVDNVSGTTSSTCLVEIRDIVTGTSSIQYLHKPAEAPVVIAKDNKVLIFRTRGDNCDRFDIYDATTGTWSIGVLPQPMPRWPAVISVNNIIYIAGGSTGTGATDQVWKLQF